MNDIVIRVMNGKYNISPDVIYNRFDLVYKTDEFIHIFFSGEEWNIPLRIEKGIAYLGLYLVEMPQIVFENLIDFVFREMPIYRIYVKKSKNNYKGRLQQGNHFRIELPDTIEELMGRMSKKGRYNYGRNRRQLQGLGNLKYMHYERENDLEDIVKIFFAFKYVTHGRKYDMSPREYIKKYMISDAYAITLDERIIAVLLSCEQCDCVYFDNFSYDMEYARYSLGFHIYVYFLGELIKRRRKEVFLLGGGVRIQEEVWKY